MNRKVKSTGPSPAEIRLKGDLDRIRREHEKLKKEHDRVKRELDRVTRFAPSRPVHPAEDRGAATAANATVPAAGVEAAPAPAPATPATPAPEVEALRTQIAELNAAKQRLSRLYFSQLEENRKRAHKLHEILENISGINAEFDLDSLLQRIAETLRASLGFRLVLIRIREPGTQLLKARAFAGIDESGRRRLETDDVRVEDFLSWLKDEFKVSRSYFISHSHAFSRELPEGFAPDLGPREDWEWHADDVLLVPLFNRGGELIAYFSVDDPSDRLVPSREVIELLEIFGNHAVVAIENARLYRQLETHSRDLEEAGRHLHEMHQLKSNFVSAVSHELRTPLTAIQAYVDTLMAAREGEITHDQLRHFMSIVNEESHRLARLIESVLDLSRFDSGTMRPSRQPLHLRELVDEALRLLEPVARVGHVTLKVVEDSADTRVDANRDQMRQLVLHLGSNAVKFTPPGGAVTMRVGGDDREVTLRVEDTGIGIPEHALDKIFERFYQVDSSLVRRYGGTGLGLSICRAIVEWHGGRIFAESHAGKGSCFTVRLPRKTAPRVVVRPSHRPLAATEDVLRLATEMVSEVMGARVVSLLSPEPNGELVIRAAIGLDEDVVHEARIRPGQGVAGWVAQNRRPVCVSGEGERSEVEGSGRARYRSRTFLSVPLESEQGLLGVLNVTDPEGQKSFDAEDCHLLLHLAERVGAAWRQALGMEQRQTEVEDTAHVLGEMLAHLARARRSAPDRVKLARSLARELGLTESEVGVISFAASIHDLGMRQLGEHVDSGGTLSDEERHAVERHPEIAVEMMRPLESVGVVRDVVLSHHEWFDGTGYPRGLADTSIPVGGRILAVVDAYESMTVGRPHRPALAREEALAELRRLRGRQFDPAIVDVFERALEDVDKQSSTAEPTWHPADSKAGR